VAVQAHLAIIGAGPAGLMLGQLLHLNNIDSVILENRSKEYVIDRVRAGVLEQCTVDLIIASGVGERLKRDGMRHDGIWLAFNGERRRIDFRELTGQSIVVYGQNEVIEDYIEAREASARPLNFEVSDVRVEDITTNRPKVHYRKEGADHEIVCDFIAGCDGFHGICRLAIPESILRCYEKLYPFAGWASWPLPRRRRKNWSTPCTSVVSLCSACDPLVSAACIFSARRTRTSANGPMIASGRNCIPGCRHRTVGASTKVRFPRRVSR
jgi:4-hydroxybenzoate 3-monooxygenase